MTPVQRNTLDFEMLFWSHLSLDNLKKCLKGRSSMQLLVPEPGVSAGGRRLGGPGGVKTAEASVWSGGRDSALEQVPWAPRLLTAPRCGGEQLPAWL